MGKLNPVLRRLAWVSVGAALLAGTAPAGGAALTQHPTGYGITLTQAQNGAVRRVPPGGPVMIRLTRNGGTGAAWRVVEGGRYVTSQGVTRNPAPPGMVGGPETDLFQFRAARRGTYLLRFSLDQPWRGGTRGAQRVHFTIVVR